jgi:hypothetical protein
VSTAEGRAAAKLTDSEADRFLEALGALDSEQPWTGFGLLDDGRVEYAFDESKVRRDPGGEGGGRFIAKGTASALGIGAKPGGREKAAKPDVVTDDPDEAVKALSEGKRVELRQPREISTLLDKLAAYAQEAKEKDGKVPNLDLCRVSVKGTNVFCSGSKGIPRLRMPQLKAANPKPGSKADKMKRDSRGEVDIMPKFIESLKARGITVTDKRESPAYLRASQAEINGAKVAGMFKAMEAGTMAEGSIMVSKDNYVVDGHHRYAAELGRDAQDGKLGDDDMAVQQVDMPILQVLAEANRFAEQWGIPSAGFGAQVKYAVWDESKVRRDPGGEGGGQFIRKGTGAAGGAAKVADLGKAIEGLRTKYKVPKTGPEREKLIVDQLGMRSGKRPDVKTMEDVEKALEPDMSRAEEKVGGLRSQEGFLARMRDLMEYIAGMLQAVTTTPYYRALAAATIATWEAEEKLTEEGTDPENLLTYYHNAEHLVHYATEHPEEIASFVEGLARVAFEEDEGDKGWSPV